MIIYSRVFSFRFCSFTSKDDTHWGLWLSISWLVWNTFLNKNLNILASYELFIYKESLKRYTTLTLTINLKEMVIINEMRNDPWYACIMNEIDWFFWVKTESKIPFASFNIRVGSQIIRSWSLLQLYPKVKSCSINKETGKQALKVCFIQMVEKHA